jgi:hypothetical protein
MNKLCSVILRSMDDTLKLFHALQKRGVILQENTASHSITQTLVIKPIKNKVREGWDKAFKVMHERKEDVLLLDDSLGIELKDWEW